MHDYYKYFPKQISFLFSLPILFMPLHLTTAMFQLAVSQVVLRDIIMRVLIPLWCIYLKLIRHTMTMMKHLKPLPKAI